MKLIITLLSLAFLLLPQIVKAKKPIKKSISKAARFRAHETTGKDYYKQKKFKKAVVSFLAAIKIKKKQGLYFNIAQCYRFIDQPEESLKYYQLFFVALDSIDRLTYRQRKLYKTEIAKRIKEMKATVLKYKNARKFLEKQRKQEKLQLKNRIAKQEYELLLLKKRKAKESSITNKWWFWVGAGATTLFAASTTLFGLKALSSVDAWESNWDPTNRDNIKKYRNYADISLGGAVLTGITTIVYTMYFKLKFSREPSSTTKKFTVIPTCSGTSCALNFTVTY
jgi:tetratricopeptide (TPR) repeat protein